MTSKIQNLEGLKRKLAVTVLADDVKNTYEKKVTEVARKAHIKGFRPGKVPANIVEQKFGKGILQEIAAELIESNLKNHIEIENIKMAGMPNVDFNHEALKKNESFEFTAQFEVYPQIQLKDLTDVAIESVSGEVSDDDVKNQLVQLRTQHAEWVVVDRAAKLGDRLTIDFEGELEGKPLEQGSAKETKLELGSNTMIPGFEDGLIGVKKGTKKTLSISFPSDYHVDTLRGKPVTFEVVVHLVEEPKLPELNDEFAKKIGVQEGVDALKQKVKEKMQTDLQEMAHSELKRHTLDKLMELNNIEVPTSLIDQEITHLQNLTRQQIRQYNRELTDAQIQQFPLAKESFQAEAKKRVLLGLLLAEVIQKEKIELDSAKVDERLKEMAAKYGEVDTILPIIKQNKAMMSDVQAYVLEEQAIQTLLAKARVSQTKKSYDAIMNAGKAQ